MSNERAVLIPRGGADQVQTFPVPCGADAALIIKAAAASPAPWVALVSENVDPREGWLEAALAAFDEFPEAAAVTAKILGADGAIESEGHELVYAAPYPVTPRPRTGGSSTDRAAIVEVATASGEALLLSVEALRALDLEGLPRRLPAAGFDLCLRLREVGGPVLCAEGAVAQRLRTAAIFDGPDASAFQRRWLASSLAGPALDGGVLAGVLPPPREVARPPVSLIVVPGDALGEVTGMVESALAQMGPRDELVVVDAGSTDGTGEVLHLIARRSGGRILEGFPSTPGLGPALLAGLERASRSIAVLTTSGAGLREACIDRLDLEAVLRSPGVQGAGVARHLVGATSQLLRAGLADAAALAAAVTGPLAAPGASAASNLGPGLEAFRSGRYDEGVAALRRTWSERVEPVVVAAVVERALQGCPAHDLGLPPALERANLSIGFDSGALVEAALLLVEATPPGARAAVEAMLTRLARQDHRAALVMARLALAAGRPADAVRWAQAALGRSSYDLACARTLRSAEAAMARSDGTVDRFDGLEAYLAGAFCEQPWRHAEVGARGELHVCCSGWLPVPIGNVHEAPFRAIWGSPSAEALRTSILDGSFRWCNPLTCHRIGGRTLPVRPDDLSAYPVRPRRGPTEVFLNHDAACNLSCPQCRREPIHGGADETARLDAMVDLFLDDALRDAREFLPNTMGEVFFSKHSRGMLRRITRSAYPELRFNLISNGQLFDRRAYEAFDLRGRLRRVNVSVDAARPETYRRVRRGGELDRLLENLAFLDGLRRSGEDAFELFFAFVVSDLNFEELPEFVRLMRTFHPERIGFSFLLNQGSFTPEEYRSLDVSAADHPRHAALLRVLAAPELAEPGVDLGSLGHLARQVRSGR